MRFATGLLVACLLALGLAACGGGGGSTADSTKATPPTVQSHPFASQGSRPAGSQEGQGGEENGAAGFRRPGADNSIPDYGVEAASGQRAAAAAALAGYLAARSGEQWSRSCSFLGAAIRRQVAAFVKASHGQAPNCMALLKMTSAQSPEGTAEPQHGALAAFRLQGDKGFALFFGPHHQRYMMPMVLEGGTWKVNQLDPIAYPPGTAPAG